MSPARFSAEELRRREARFKQATRTLGFSAGVSAYVEGHGEQTSLFADELAWLRQDHTLPAPDLLAFTVGTSFRPILLSIGLCAPRRVVFLLAPSYQLDSEKIDGEAYGSLLEDCARRIGVEGLETSAHVLKDGDSPTAVFAAARKCLIPLLGPGVRGAIDVTSSKKSMSVGAFLFAAYSGMDIQYFDFTGYDPASGTPYVDGRRLRTLSDPTSTFQLALWDRARIRYELGDFEGAHDMIVQWRGIVEKAGTRVPIGGETSVKGRTPVLFGPEDAARLQRLTDVIGAYAMWQNGDFREAGRAMRTAIAEGVRAESWRLPTVIEPDFADRWVQFKAGQTLEQLRTEADKLSALTNDPTRFHEYARDELAKLWRLIRSGRDYRSVFLRAQGLSELLLDARFRYAAAAREILVDPATAAPPRRLRAQSLAEFLFTGRLRDKVTIRLADGSPARLPEDCLGVSNGLPLFKTLADLRNAAIHHMMNIPSETAALALETASANLRHLEESRGMAGVNPPHTEAVPWEDLVRACEVPFPSRSSEVIETT